MKKKLLVIALVVGLVAIFVDQTAENYSGQQGSLLNTALNNTKQKAETAIQNTTDTTRTIAENATVHSAKNAITAEMQRQADAVLSKVPNLDMNKTELLNLAPEKLQALQGAVDKDLDLSSDTAVSALKDMVSGKLDLPADQFSSAVGALGSTDLGNLSGEQVAAALQGMSGSGISATTGDMGNLLGTLNSQANNLNPGQINAAVTGLTSNPNIPDLGSVSQSLGVIADTEGIAELSSAGLGAAVASAGSVDDIKDAVAAKLGATDGSSGCEANGRAIYASAKIPGGTIYKSHGLVYGTIVIGDGPDETGPLSLALSNITGDNEHISVSGKYNYTNEMVEARDKALDRMWQNKSESGGNAIVDVRFQDTLLYGEAIEVTVYGTAVDVAFCGECEPPC